jgi:hypothetical protein
MRRVITLNKPVNREPVSTGFLLFHMKKPDGGRA